MTKISGTLGDLDRMIKELAAYKKWFIGRTKALTEAVAIAGAMEATHWFGTAAYDGVNDVTVDVSPMSSGNGWVITANGEAAAFIEFGSGIYWNGAEPYPNPRPDGIVKIGEYGKQQGKKDFWYYTPKEGGKGVRTHGNPAAMPMFHATERMKQDLIRIAREVFASG